MTTAAPSTALATIQPAFTDPERLALAGFLAGYRGPTREAYAKLCRHNFAYASRVPSASHVNRDAVRNRASTGSSRYSGSMRIGWPGPTSAASSRWSRSAHPASTGARRAGTGRPRDVQYSDHSAAAPASEITTPN